MFLFILKKKQIHTLSKTHFASDMFDTYIAKRLIKVNSIPDSTNTTCTPFVTMLFIMKGRRRQIGSGAANASQDLFEVEVSGICSLRIVSKLRSSQTHIYLFSSLLFHSLDSTRNLHCISSLKLNVSSVPF